MDIITLLVALAVVAVSLFVLYYVIKGAVLAALREHTLSSTTAVMIKSSVPLTTVSSQHEQPEQQR